MSLLEQQCEACHVKIPPLDKSKVRDFVKQLRLDWEVVEGKKIKYQFKFKDFVEAMVFVNKVADIAEEQGHHPNLHIFYNKVSVELWTHFIGGLHKNDFILAAKIEAV
jgi:4a-hydroxytetrahydrobiopterin dehydratase